MKPRAILFLALIPFVGAACNMTLAQDVTPPPGFVPPSPVPTHGAVFPAEAPDLENGELIFAEKCAACHGENGMGDGPQSQQLPVSVPSLASSEVAAKASPADWFLIVTLGNIDNFMPPFNSLSEQERWDVVAYAQSLGRSPDQIKQGEQLFLEICADCPLDSFTDQARMAALSTDDLVGMLTEGEEGTPDLGGKLTEDELRAVAAYLQTLTLNDSNPVVEEAPATATAIPPQPESLSTETTPPAGTQTSAVPSEATAILEGIGIVSGSVVNGSGGRIPSGLTVTLLGFDHATDASANPEEAITRTAEVSAEGSFQFDDIEMPEGRIFLAEVEYRGIPFQSEMSFTPDGSNEVTLPEVTIYESTTETGALVTEELFVFSEFNADGTVRIFQQYYITNQSDHVVEVETDGNTIPILPVPEGVMGLSFQPTQDSAPLLPTEAGFALPPSDQPYGIIAFYSLPYDKNLDLTLPFALPVSVVSIVVPEGVKIRSEQLADEGLREMQPGATFHIYSGSGLQANDTLNMTIYGKVKSGAASIGEFDDRQVLLIGVGLFGMVLVLAGGWLYLRDRNNADEEDFDEEGQEEFETAEDIMDAIIALDDLHRAKKIPDEAYLQRRAELKNLLSKIA